MLNPADPAGLTLRLAEDADRPTVQRLAQLDSADAPTGRVLLALVDTEPIAALSLDDGRAVATPFARTAEVLALLRLRASQLSPVPASRPRLRLIRSLRPVQS